jgi:hypothetical protein
MVDTLSRRVRGIGRWLVPALLVALAGCQTDRPDPNRPDPLTGLPKRIPPADRAVSSTYDPAGQTRAAMVAASGSRPSDNNSGLSIRDSRGADADRSTQPAGAWTGNQSRGGAAPATGARGDAVPASSSSTSSSSGLHVRTFEEAQQFLGARGVKWQELKNTGENEWVFSCSIPNKSSSSVRTYEARDRYGLVAMQKVIDQILREQQSR